LALKKLSHGSEKQALNGSLLRHTRVGAVADYRALAVAIKI
jgi:hypothetical protein